MNINGVELVFDATDADTLEKYLGAVEECAQKANAIESPGNDKKKVAEVYRKMCGYIKTAFDEIFGEGAGEKVCGKNDSVRTCREAYQTLMEEYDRQMAEEKIANEEFNRIVNKK